MSDDRMIALRNLAESYLRLLDAEAAYRKAAAAGNPQEAGEPCTAEYSALQAADVDLAEKLAIVRDAK